MIFPIDVHKRASQAGKLVGKDKTNFIFSTSIVVTFLSFLGVTTVFKKFLGLGIGWAFIAQLILTVLVGGFVFRHFVFDEDSKRREQQTSEKDSFAEFHHMRKEVSDTLNVNNKLVNLFEYENGSSMFCIRIKYGSNDKKRAANTEMMFKEIFRILALNGLEIRTTTMPENYENSDEYNDFLDKLNGIEDRATAHAMIEIADGLFEDARVESNVDITYILVRTRSNYQKYEFENVVSNILTEVGRYPTCLRDFSFLNREFLNEYLREFYGLEAIDLSMIKALATSEKLQEQFTKIVSVYQMTSESGKSVVNKTLLEDFLDEDV